MSDPTPDHPPAPVASSTVERPAPLSAVVLRLALVRGATTSLVLAALLGLLAGAVLDEGTLGAFVGLFLGALGGLASVLEAAAARRGEALTFWTPGRTTAALTGAVSVIIVQAGYARATTRGRSLDDGVAAIERMVVELPVDAWIVGLGAFALPTAVVYLVVGFARVHGMRLLDETVLALLSASMLGFAGMIVSGVTGLWFLPAVLFSIAPVLAASVPLTARLADRLHRALFPGEVALVPLPPPPPQDPQDARTPEGIDPDDDPRVRARATFDPVFGTWRADAFVGTGIPSATEVGAADEPEDDAPVEDDVEAPRLAPTADGRCPSCRADLSGESAPEFCFHCGEALAIGDVDD